MSTGFPSHKRHKNPKYLLLSPDHVAHAWRASCRFRRARFVQRGCGRFDGFWEFNLNPWDTAAGVLIVEEAGGKSQPLRRFAIRTQ